MTLTRREFVAATAASSFLVADWLAAAPADDRYGEAFRLIDTMIERYMRDMNAPGLTLAIADRNAPLRIATYGFSDPETKTPVRPDHLFHIGSITKSFVAISLLQMRDEGKIDLHAPVARYLPWLRIEPRDVITTHHLLSHSSGLPSWVPVFPSDAATRITAGFTPGTHYHYCNLGYAILGHLLEALDGRPYPDVIHARVFRPLGMKASHAVIGPDLRDRTVNSHVAYLGERPFRRNARLAEAPQIIFDNAAGSISSTPGDMALYLRMLANRGKPLLGETSFADLAKRHIRRAGTGDDAYGYGLFVEKLDDHEIVRHTGGMVSFMSAMHVDVEDGIGAFASINAHQGYRPNPVTIFALRAIRAVNAGKPLPELPPPNPPTLISGASDYAGVYTSPSGEKIEFVADGDALFLADNGKRHAVEIATGDFYVDHPAYDRFPFAFEREKKTEGRAVSVGHGARWWTSDRYTGARTFTVPDAWRAYVGHYRNEDPWMGSLRVVLRQGKLWLDGTGELRPVDANTFRFAEPEHNPEWIQFLDVVNGHAQRVKLSGYDLWRVGVG